MQFTLTNHFSPAERALLHATLLHIKEQNQEQQIADSINRNSQAKLYKEFQTFTDATLNELLQKLFHDCFLEDLDFIKQFAKQRNSVLNSNIPAPAL